MQPINEIERDALADVLGGAAPGAATVSYSTARQRAKLVTSAIRVDLSSHYYGKPGHDPIQRMITNAILGKELPAKMLP